MSVVISSYINLYLLYHLLVNLAKGLSILLIFLKAPTLLSIDYLYILFFLCFDISPMFVYLLLSTLFFYAIFSFYSRTFGDATKLLIWVLFTFLIQTLLPFRTAFIVSPRFEYIVFLFILKISLTLIKFEIPFLMFA